MERLKWLRFAAATFATGLIQADHPALLPNSPAIIRESTLSQEVQRLAQTYPKDSIVRKVYTDNLSRINPIFRPNLQLSMDTLENALAAIRFKDQLFSEKQRFVTLSLSNQVKVQRPTLDQMTVEVVLFPQWFESGDSFKKLLMEKEALNIFLFDSFSQSVLETTWLRQAKIFKIDSTVTQLEIARTLGYQILMESPDALKLFDYAGFLPLLSRVESFDIQQRPAGILPDLYRRAQMLGIPFQELKPGTDEFWYVATGANSPWVKMVLNPSMPHPPKPIIP